MLNVSQYYHSSKDSENKLDVHEGRFTSVIFFSASIITFEVNQNYLEVLLIISCSPC
jgi:hypothetical protein